MDTDALRCSEFLPPEIFKQRLADCLTAMYREDCASDTELPNH